MAINPNYETIGKSFVQQYYALFDGDATQRAGLAAFYSETSSLMTFEGQQMMGRNAIVEKLQNLTFQKIQHIVTTVDCQPVPTGGVLVYVFGQLKTDDDPPHSFNQVFLLNQDNSGAFFVQNDIFRLALAM